MSKAIAMKSTVGGPVANGKAAPLPKMTKAPVVKAPDAKAKPAARAGAATPAAKPAAKAAAKPVAKTTVKAAAKPAAKPAAKAAPKAVASKAAAKPAAKAAATTASKAAAKSATKSATKPAAKPAVKAVAKPVAKAAVKAAPKVTPKAAAKAPAARPVEPAKDKQRKDKLVRDSFTMPEQEYAVLGQVKKACLKAGFEIKKSELLRIGVALISQIDLATLQNVLSALPQLKTGRPKKN